MPRKDTIVEGRHIQNCVVYKTEEGTLKTILRTRGKCFLSEKESASSAGGEGILTHEGKISYHLLEKLHLTLFSLKQEPFP